MARIHVLVVITLQLAIPTAAGYTCTDAWCPSPEAPAQNCRDDAGPPWTDDAEHFPSAHYHTASPAEPLPSSASGGCPIPLSVACAAKGTKAAYLDGPIDCGGAGWFCRIVTQEGWMNGNAPREYRDKNFAHCNATDADERDDDGHCHGSSADDTYGWWIRDHWHRGYAGTLHCCCDWATVKGLVNRCDYRRHVDPSEAGSCRDANEDHGLSYEGGCAAHATVPFSDPLYQVGGDMCWSVRSFADPESVGSDWDGEVWQPPPTEPTTYKLTVGTIRQAETATFRLIGGETSAKPIVAYSLKGLGSTNLPQLGVTLDLKQPKQLSVPTNADGNGATEWSVRIPANAPIGPVFFQALKSGSVSNVVEAEILPGLPVGVSVGDLVRADGDLACVYRLTDDGMFRIEYMDGNRETADLSWVTVVERCAAICDCDLSTTPAITLP